MENIYKIIDIEVIPEINNYLLKKELKKNVFHSYTHTHTKVREII